MADERPTGLKASSGIELLTLNTPNGYKASILLEELKNAYGTQYTWQSIDISKGIQKEPWFTALNPNGRIPVIVDHDRNKLAVFEGAAILNYLVRRFDTDHTFSFDPATEPDQVAIAESWIAWQHGGVGPMQGQANHFVHFAADKQDFYAAQRYVGETERLYGILNTHLADRDFVAGTGRGKYSIADISILGWAQALHFSGADTSHFPHVLTWLDRCTARPATARGLAVPKPAFYANPDAEFLEKFKLRLEFVEEAKKKFDYKFQTP